MNEEVQATESWSKLLDMIGWDCPADSIMEHIEREPPSFEFFQAVRLIELAACYLPSERGTKSSANPVGLDSAPNSESLRFRASPSLSFPATEIDSFEPAFIDRSGRPVRRPAQMVVSFMGLTGPSGILPRHYSQYLIDELREDRGMLEFFEIFNHRLIAIFYRAWRKYQFPVSYECYHRSSGDTHERSKVDPCTFALFSLAGIGTEALRGRQVIPDEGLLCYAGLFSNPTRNAISLERMVSEYFELPTEIIQFQGQWLQIAPEDQTKLVSNGSLGAANNQLGISAIAGEQVWGIENKFRVRLGPLNYHDFIQMLPGGKQLVPLAQLVRSYAGPDLDFDVQAVLRREEIPACSLGDDGELGPRLGWNTWIWSTSPERDADDAVFQVDGEPIV